MSSVIGRYEPSVEEKGQRTVGLLCRWAEDNKVDLTEIPPEAGPTPDFRAELPDGTVLAVEVKEICHSFESVLEDSGEIVNRVCQEGVIDLKDLAKPHRKKIKSANRQLRSYSDEGVATLTLIGVWNPCIESVLDYLPLATSGDNRIRLDGTPFILQGISGGKELGGEMNTSTSAVGRFVGVFPGEGPLSILVFEHENPKVPIPRGLPGFSDQAPSTMRFLL